MTRRNIDYNSRPLLNSVRFGSNGYVDLEMRKSDKSPPSDRWMHYRRLLPQSPERFEPESIQWLQLDKPRRCRQACRLQCGVTSSSESCRVSMEEMVRRLTIERVEPSLPYNVGYVCTSPSNQNRSVQGILKIYTFRLHQQPCRLRNS